MAHSSQSVKSGLRRHMPYICIVLGAASEALIVVLHFFMHYPLLVALLGIGSTILLWYGAFSLLRAFGARQSASIFVIASGVGLLLFRIFDVYATLNFPRMEQLLGVRFDIDQMLVNLAIVTAGFCMLMGILLSLYDAHSMRLQLAEQNVLLAREIIERQQSERRARASEEQLNVLLNGLSVSVFLVNRMGLLVAYNDHFARLFGPHSESLVGRFVGEAMPPDLCEMGKQNAKGVLDNGEPAMFTCTHDDYVFEVAMYPICDANGLINQVAVLARDVSGQIQQEQERLLLETAVNHSAESIMITDDAGHILYVNPAFEALTGYQREEILGRTPAFLHSGQHDVAFYRSLWMTIRNGSVWKGTFVNRKKSGEIFSENATISPIRNEAGAITHYIGVKRDVTRELQLEQQLQQAQKIEAIGALAGGIAHDINNVFAIILGHSELAREKVGEEHAAANHLSTITRTAQRSSQLIKRLLIFSRRKNEDAETIDLSAFVLEQMKMVRAYLPSNIAIMDDISRNAGCVFAPPGEVQQVIFNLCTNASQAMQPAGGTLEISLAALTLTEPRMFRTGEALPGAYLRLRIRDTGCGMDEETLKRIFDPFFTTKSVEKGTGLGLSTVHDVMNRLGGYVDVKSAPGRGSCFDAYWPSSQPEEAKEVGMASTEYRDSGHTLLLVEDMEDFRELSETILSGYGFKVVSCADPFQALAYFKDHHQEVDAALVDYMMPGMNGIELARELRYWKRELPIALLSGYASGVNEDNATEHGFQIMLRKPTPAKVLVSAMANLVASVNPRTP